MVPAVSAKIYPWIGCLKGTLFQVKMAGVSMYRSQDSILYWYWIPSMDEDFDTITVDVNTVYPIAEAGDGSELTCNVTAVVLNGTGSAVSPLVVY